MADKTLIDGLFEKYHFDVVVNLAAQAGVRYSITNPDAYIQSNMMLADITPWSTWYMLLQVLCMVAIRRCRSRRMTV